MNEFWMVLEPEQFDQSGPYETHAEAVIEAQRKADRHRGRTYAIGHFKEAWGIVASPPVRLELEPAPILEAGEEPQGPVPGMEQGNGIEALGREWFANPVVMPNPPRAPEPRRRR